MPWRKDPCPQWWRWFLFLWMQRLPIIDVNTVDMNKVYLKSRYDKGEAAYLNCPNDQTRVYGFSRGLGQRGRSACLTLWKKKSISEGCMPIEVMAKRGIKTMLYGPMEASWTRSIQMITKGHVMGNLRHPYAVVQLRQDNAAASLYNIVGFQTHL